MSQHYQQAGYAPQYGHDNAQPDAQAQAQQPTQQQPDWQNQVPPPHMNQYPPQMPPGYYAQPQGQPHAHPYQGQASMPPQMHPGYYHPGYSHPHYAPHPMWGHPQMMPPGYYPHPPMPEQAPAQAQANTDESDPFMEQAQAMLEQALGEEAGMFKEILGSLGMNDKEFWKGAMVGAAAALLLSNDKVRGKLMDVVSGAGDMLKTGGCKVKDSATDTAQSVRESVNNGGEIFKDTYTAGKQGFQQSVERHNQQPVDNMAQTPAETDELVTEIRSLDEQEMKPV
ncbi:hypothetical protein ACFOD0_10040 [Shewanella intestini]|uniref:YtxH domain-containing protein n=1 Tax=Shewanella TaxID=22 RepID=UPI00189028E3|nr:MULTISPECIES: YtxH domain-containing protein [Shewanella]